MEHGFENVGGKEVRGTWSSLAFSSMDLSVHFIVSRVHAQKYQVKGDLVVALQVLEQFGHEHGILAPEMHTAILSPGWIM